MVGEDCRYDSEVTDPSRTVGPTVSLCRLSQRTDALALQLETDTRDARDCGPGGAYRADGILENTVHFTHASLSTCLSFKETKK